MNKYLLQFLFLCCFGFSSLAQQEVQHFQSGYLCKIRLTGVDDFVKAKEIAFTLQTKFNNFPHFNDESDQFEFYSDITVSNKELTDLLIPRGYVIDLYEQNACAPCEIKEQEQ